MSLVLRPTLRDCTREDIEAHVEAIRIRRMSASLAYHELKNTKISTATAKVQGRLDKQLQMLEREINALERADDKVQDRLAAIEVLRQEMGFLIEQLVDPNEEKESD